MSSIWRKNTQKSRKTREGRRRETPPVLPGYVTGELIGEGAASEVWAAHCTQTGELVALKRLRGSATQQDLQRLRAEAGLLASFSHPNVIGLRGVRSDDAGLVLVLERAAHSLTELLDAQGVLSAGRVVGVLAPIADALEQAHARGILHGDISPGNILLRADGVPLLADLGTARLAALCAGGLSSPIAGSGVYGTPGFTDPALQLGEPFIAASDVYSLAAVAACALVGQRLDDEPDAIQSWANRAHQLGVPPGLASAVCATLVAPPARRPTAAQLATALRKSCPAISLLPVEISPPPQLSTTAYDVNPDPMVRADDVTRQVGSPDRTVDRAVTGRTVAGQRRTTMLRAAAVVTFIVGVGLGGGLAVTALGHDDPFPQALSRRGSPLTPVEVAANYWRNELDQLDAARARSFVSLDAGLLTGVYAPTSPMLRADQEQIARLQRLGAAATGLRHRFRAIHVLRQIGGEVLIQTSEQLQAHRVVRRVATASQGEMGDNSIRVVPTSTPHTVRISLVTASDKWRISAITPA